MKKFLSLLIIFIFMFSFAAYATEFVPQGDINGKDIYNIKNFVNITGAYITATDGYLGNLNVSGNMTANHASLINLNWADAGHTFDTDLDVTPYSIISNNVTSEGVLNLSQGVLGSSGLIFGRAKAGIVAASDTAVFLHLNSSMIYKFQTNYLQFGASGGYPGVMIETASSTNPVFVPERDDSDTGIGQAGANQLSLIAGGNEILRLNNDSAIDVEQNIDATGFNITLSNLFGNLNASYIQNAYWIESADEANLNVNYSTTSGTATTWDGETSQADLNVNSSSYWDALNSPSDITGLDSTNIDSLNWTKLQNYPVACSAGYAITELDDSVTCTEFLQESSNASFESLEISDNGDTMNFYLDGTDSFINWSDNTLKMFSEESNTIVQIGKNLAGGSGFARLILQDDSGAYSTEITQDDGYFYINPEGSAAHVKFTMAGGDFLVNNTADADTLHIEGTTSYVGIGVASPASKLDVDGGITTNSFINHTIADGNTREFSNGCYEKVNSTGIYIIC